METLKFTTNIKCGGCTAGVTPTLNNLKGVDKWEVDTTTSNKNLSIQTNNGLTAKKVVESLTKPCYQAQTV
ncbi:MAG: hypothetical protein EOP42_06640 [Sphingobacteriaceae bacterium]|nr:MAG: hypothetical protein EOP42_06640 [Sphingobacteriaceae bacterium]